MFFYITNGRHKKHIFVVDKHYCLIFAIRHIVPAKISGRARRAVPVKDGDAACSPANVTYNTKENRRVQIVRPTTYVISFLGSGLGTKQ